MSLAFMPSSQQASSSTLQGDDARVLRLLLSRFSRVRLCNPIDGSPPGSPFPGILQARTLEWVAIAFSAKNSTWGFSVKETESLNKCRA